MTVTLETGVSGDCVKEFWVGSLQAASQKHADELQSLRLRNFEIPQLWDRKYQYNSICHHIHCPECGKGGSNLDAFVWNPGIPICFDRDALEYGDKDSSRSECKYKSADAVEDVVEATAWEYTSVEQEDRGLDNEYGGIVKNFRGNRVLEAVSILQRHKML